MQLNHIVLLPFGNYNQRAVEDNSTGEEIRKNEAGLTTSLLFIDNTDKWVLKG
jgi:hypothetical protein